MTFSSTPSGTAHTETRVVRYLSCTPKLPMLYNRVYSLFPPEINGYRPRCGTDRVDYVILAPCYTLLPGKAGGRMGVIATRSKQKSGAPFLLLHINPIIAGEGLHFRRGRIPKEGPKELLCAIAGPNAGSPPLELRRELPKCPHSHRGSSPSPIPSAAYQLLDGRSRSCGDIPLGIICIRCLLTGVTA